MPETKTFEVQEECPACKGTGIFTGMAERDGMGVVCSKCKGTGCATFRHVYKEFTGRKGRDDVLHVIEANPGIITGTKAGSYPLSGFGGIPYSEWVKTGTFPPGSEMRAFVCPAWFYQSADYKKKPNWAECGWGAFSHCRSFPNKAACWARWDMENGT